MTYSSDRQQIRRLDPEVERAARRSDMPDGGLNNRPVTPRITEANLDLSIIIYVITGVVALVSIFWLLH